MEYEPKQDGYLPTSDFLDLELHLMDSRPGVRPEAFVTELVQRWLAIEMERLALRKNGAVMRGFQWKKVFLPDGTSLRTSYRDTIKFAKVVGDRIVSGDGASLTPSLLASRHTNGRNAWRFVWLRFPGDGYWVRAANCWARSDDQLRMRSKKRTEMYKTVYSRKADSLIRSKVFFAKANPVYKILRLGDSRLY